MRTFHSLADLGYDLLLRLLAVVKPSILANLESTSGLNFLVIFDFPSPFLIAFSSQVPEIYRRITTRINRSLNSSIESVPRLSPSQLRNCQIAGYLAQCFTQSEKPIANSTSLFYTVLFIHCSLALGRSAALQVAL
jgi:hypothetical protein